MKLDQWPRVQPGRGLAVQKRDGKINLAFEQPAFDLREVTRPQGHLERREFLFQALQRPRQMVAQNDFSGADPQILIFAPRPNPFRDGIEVVKERLDELEQGFAGREKLKGTPLK